MKRCSGAKRCIVQPTTSGPSCATASRLCSPSRRALQTRHARSSKRSSTPPMARASSDGPACGLRGRVHRRHGCGRWLGVAGVQGCRRQVDDRHDPQGAPAVSDKLSMWTVYDHPRDYPNTFIARRWEIGHGDEPVATTDIIESPMLGAIRTMLAAKGLTCLHRQWNDDPNIMETWV